jgi:putative ABC transport system substrate-binding protein
VKRRELLALLGGGMTAWSLDARAQQSAMPVIGFFHLTSLEARERENLAAFHRGLSNAGYMEGRNVALEYLWAQGRNDQLPALANELVRRQVSLIVILESTTGALAAQAATQTIPIVFMQAVDPVRIGLVASLSRPGGNLTGIVLLGVEYAAKRLQLLLELVPAATTIGYLRNPSNPGFAESETREVEIAARGLGVSLLFLDASRPSEIEAAFSKLAEQRVEALYVAADGFFMSRRDQIIALAARYVVPAIYGWPAPGGLIYYSTNFRDAWRLAGDYTGRILRGENPANMPVQQITKIDLILDLKAAKGLGLAVPQSLFARADEVIQ